MGRAASGDVVTVAASNNVYTVLAVVGTVGVILALVVLFLRSHTLGVKLY